MLTYFYNIPLKIFSHEKDFLTTTLNDIKIGFFIDHPVYLKFYFEISPIDISKYNGDFAFEDIDYVHQFQR